MKSRKRLSIILVFVMLLALLPSFNLALAEDTDNPADLTNGEIVASDLLEIDLTRPAVYTAAEGNIARLETPNVRQWANASTNGATMYSLGMGDFAPIDANITRTGIITNFSNPGNGNNSTQSLRLTDGTRAGTNMNTSWNTAGIGMGSDRTYVVINWGEPFEIFATRVEWWDNASTITPPNIARVEYYDGLAWHEVKNMKNAAGVSVTDIPTGSRGTWGGVTFDPIVTKMLRLTMAKTGSRDNGIIGMSEWEVFGESAGGYSPAEQAKSDLDAITLPGTATENLTLPVEGGLFGSDINWASSHGSVISETGAVTRPAFGSPNSNVTLTATAGNYGATEVRTFTITVPALPSANNRALEDLAAITLPAETQSNLMLPTIGGEYSSNIVWTSSHPAVISTAGAVTPPPFSGTNATVTLTAEATNDGVTANKSFTVEVHKMLVGADPETYANPINISYAFQQQQNTNMTSIAANKPSWHRDMADAQPVYFDADGNGPEKGEYWLFPSFASGYFYSDDLVNWSFVDGRSINGINRYAPGAFVMNGYIYVSRTATGEGSGLGQNLHRTKTPHDADSWERVRDSSTGDPHYFYDEETGRLFQVHGLISVNETTTQPPDRIMELDPDSPTLEPLPIDPTHPNAADATTPTYGAGGYPIFWSARQIRGYEVPGLQNDDYNSRTSAWLEGTGMFKHDGRYYIYHAGPSCFSSGYSDALWVSDDPLGPYEWVTNNPFTYKATGFTQSSSHGHHVYLNGNENERMWKFGSPHISVISTFERRISLYPVDFDNNGTPYTDLAFADYPMYKPTNPKAAPDSLGPGWQLLSFDATATASSTYDYEVISTKGYGYSFRISPSKAFDESMRTWWSAKTGEPGEWLMGDMGKVKTVNAIQLNLAEQDNAKYVVDSLVNIRAYSEPYRYLLEGSVDGNNWFIIADKSNYVPFGLGDDYVHDYYELADGVSMRYIRVTNKGPVPADGKFAISGLRLFGNGGGTAPAAVDSSSITLSRYPGRNNRTVVVNWDEVPDATGYVIRFGPSEDELTLHRMVVGGDTTEDIINILTTDITNAKNDGAQLGMDYYFRIDSFNDSGVTEGTKVIHLKQSDSRYRLDYSVVGTAGDGTLTAKVDGDDLESFRTGDGGSMYLVEEGKDIVFTASPSPEYKIKEWKVNGTVYQQPAGTTYTDTTFTFENVSDNVQVTIEYEYIPSLQIQLLTTSKILEKCAANIKVKVTPIGFTPENPVEVELKGQDGTIYGTAHTDKDGVALVRASAFPSAGTYTFVATGEDVAGSLDLNVVPYNPGIWDAIPSASDGGSTMVTFGETPVPKNGASFDGCVTVNGGTPLTGTSVVGNAIVIPYQFDKLEIGDKIVISGVKYPDLFPSYSFTFTVEIK